MSVLARARGVLLGEGGALLALLLAVAGAHLAAFAAQPAPAVWGDENTYHGYARADARAGRTSLLPGTLPFDHRPLYAARVFALLADAEVDGPELLRRVTPLHVLLLVLALAGTYATARLLGLRPPGALAATALLGTLPQLGYYVHALWPEIVHLFLFSLGLLALVHHLRTGRLVTAALAGLACGLALLTKGSLQPFVPLVPVVLAARAWRAAEGEPPQRALAALAPAALFALALAAVVGPQLRANARAGHGWRLSANRWWNLELGLTLSYAETSGEGLARWRPVAETSLRYWSASQDPVERERLARERTLAYVREHGVLAVAWDQLRETARLVLAGEPALAQSLRDRPSPDRPRWGSPPPGWIVALAAAGRGLWYVLLVLAAHGAFARVRSGALRAAPWALLALFSLAFGGALLLVPVKFRFLLPLVPVLSLWAGAGVEDLLERLARRRRPAAAGLPGGPGLG